MTATTLRRICVTGATGKAGLATVRELREHGYDVVATDVAVSGDDASAGVLRADLTDYGQATEVLRGTDAVVHLANIPAPGRSTPAVTFNANITMNFNVFHAAAALGLAKVVWASSETTLGLPFGGGPEEFAGAPGELRYAPVDEDHFPFPATTYGLSKVASETLAEQISRWSQIPFVGLRISNIMEPHEYQRFPSYWPDPHPRKWNVWGYVDVRDVAAACRLGLEADLTGSHNVIIAAADTVMNRPSRDLLAEVFPDVPVTGDIAEFGTLLAIGRARELLGYNPRHSWRDHLSKSLPVTDPADRRPRPALAPPWTRRLPCPKPVPSSVRRLPCPGSASSWVRLVLGPAGALPRPASASCRMRSRPLPRTCRMRIPHRYSRWNAHSPGERTCRMRIRPRVRRPATALRLRADHDQPFAYAPTMISPSLTRRP